MHGQKLSNNSAVLLTIAWKLPSLSGMMPVITCTIFSASYVTLIVSW